MPVVFAAFEVLGTGLIHAGSPVGDGALSLDWWIKGVGDISASTAAVWDGDPVARGLLLPGTTCACPSFFFFLQCKLFFDLIDF